MTLGESIHIPRKTGKINIRAADAKEVGVGNPAEETYCYPNNRILETSFRLSTRDITKKSTRCQQERNAAG